MSKRLGPKPEIDWKRYDGRAGTDDIYAEHTAAGTSFRLLVVRAGTRWAWAVTAPGESISESPDGLVTIGSRGAAQRAAVRAVRRRAAALYRRPMGRPRRDVAVQAAP